MNNVGVIPQTRPCDSDRFSYLSIGESEDVYVFSIGVQLNGKEVVDNLV